MLAQGAAIDKRRKIRGRTRVPRAFQPLTEEELARSGALFHDKVKQDLDRCVLRGERAIKLKQILKQYSKTQEGFESLSVVSLHFRNGFTISAIAKRRSTYDKNISGMLVHDCQALRVLFSEAGIQNLRDIWSD
jgi:hypothetical protein